MQAFELHTCFCFFGFLGSEKIATRYMCFPQGSLNSLDYLSMWPFDCFMLL